MIIQHPSTHLTSNYRKDKDSNNYKILDLGHQQHLHITENLKRIEHWRNVDEAEGFPLDKIGKNVLELREGREDEVFRRAIAIKIRGNLSAGTIDDLNALGYALFGDSFLYVSEAWHQASYDYEPAKLILSVSYNQGLNSLFWYYKNLLEDLTAGGVGLWVAVQTEPIVFNNPNQFRLSALEILLTMWNITRPKRMIWDGVIKFNGEHLWGSDIEQHGIKMPYLLMSAFGLETHNTVQVQNFTMNLSISYHQPGINVTLTSNIVWSGFANFDGQTKWDGIHQHQEEVL